MAKQTMDASFRTLIDRFTHDLTDAIAQQVEQQVSAALSRLRVEGPGARGQLDGRRSGRLCPVPGCGETGAGPRNRWFCREHAGRLSAAEQKSILDATGASPPKASCRRPCPRSGSCGSRENAAPPPGAGHELPRRRMPGIDRAVLAPGSSAISTAPSCRPMSSAETRESWNARQKAGTHRRPDRRRRPCRPPCRRSWPGRVRRRRNQGAARTAYPARRFRCGPLK